MTKRTVPHQQAERPGDQPRAAPAPGTDHQAGPAGGNRPQVEAPDPVQVRPRQAPDRGSEEWPGQPVARLQHQGAVRFHNRHGPPVAGPLSCRPASRLCHSGTMRSALGSPLLSSQSQLYQFSVSHRSARRVRTDQGPDPNIRYTVTVLQRTPHMRKRARRRGLARADHPDLRLSRAMPLRRVGRAERRVGARLSRSHRVLAALRAWVAFTMWGRSGRHIGKLFRWLPVGPGP